MITRWLYWWSRDALPKAVGSMATVGGVVNANLTRGARNSIMASTTRGGRGRGTDTRAVG